MRKISNILLMALVFTLMLNTACENTTETTDVVEKDSVGIDIDEKMGEVKEIFYSLPAPLEVTNYLLKDKSAFDEEILNSVDNALNYSSEAALAYNLGVYSADLSYAGLFDQNQIVINFMATSKDIAEQLGILEAFDDKTIKELENNINNRDEITRIISENFMNSDAYLQENGRYEIGAMILIGGWLEGLFIAVELLENSPNDNLPLLSSILEQQLSLELMALFLDDFNEASHQQLNVMKKDLADLSEIFNSVKVNVTDDGYLSVDEKDFEKIRKKVVELRTKIVELT